MKTHFNRLALPIAMTLLMSSLGSASAQLEGPIESTPAAGFTNGTTSGLSPQTDGEDFDCAVHWDVWHSAYAGDFMPLEIERALPGALSRGATSTTRDEWQQVVAATRGTTPIMALIEIIKVTPKRERSQDQMLGGLRGDKAQLFRISQSLGICASPPRPE